jgi:hypothetical protein
MGRLFKRLGITWDFTLPTPVIVAAIAFIILFRLSLAAG